VIPRGAAAALAALVLSSAGAATGLLAPVDLFVRDVVLRTLPRRDARSVTVVLVDEDALRSEGPWPWSRELLARLVDRVRESGARGVVLDILLPESRPGDDVLAAALARLPAVLAVGIDDRRGWLLPAAGLAGRATLAHVSFDTDRDGVVRRFLATRQDAERSLPALAVAAARLVDPERVVSVGAVLRPGFRASEPRAVSAAALLSGRPAGSLAGRIVFVGVSAAGIGDRVVSPVSPGGKPVAGVMVQAAAAESLLSGDVLRPVAPLLTGLLACVASLLAARRKGPLAALATALSPFPASVMVLSVNGLELPAVTAAAGAVVVTAPAVAAAATRQGRESAAAARRVRELTALAASLEAGRRDEAEARRVVAHELKTPLTSVRGLAQLLADFDLSEEERRRVAGMVVNETSRLAAMVEALLDLERMKLRDFDAHARRLDLSRLVTERAAVLGPGSGRRLELSVEPGLHVTGDAALLGRIVENLVGNAVKFSPEGSPVALRLAASSTREAVLEVADRGPGVAPAERETIFRRFARGGATASVPGLGLGLALVAQAASWHGGRVEVDGNPGGGSVFRLRLPLAPGAEGAV